MLATFVMKPAFFVPFRQFQTGAAVESGESPGFSENPMPRPDKTQGQTKTCPFIFR